ncbi:MAG: choice-of-anchor D domain-containing protein [Deltaproteobacteria bacterium]|nr:choice-of-anchor D domain-containing protein [Deltaproteobacteria bacterium]
MKLITRLAGPSPLSLLLAVACGLGIGLAQGCDSGGGGLRAAGDPSLLVLPDPVVFNAAPIGAEVSRELLLRNTGSSDLIALSFTLSNELSGREFRVVTPELPLVIAAGAETPVTLVYTPQDAGLDSGALLIESNSREGRLTRVEILTVESEGELLYPSTVDVFLGPCDESITQVVAFSNLGTTQVRVTGVRLSDDSSGGFEVVGTRVTEGGAEVEGAGLEVAQGQRLEVEVRYSRANDGDDRATLEVSYEGDEGAPHTVTLRGAELTPRVDVLPESVEFGAVDLGQETPVQQVFLTNNGTSALRVRSLALAINDPAVNAQFTLHDVPVAAGEELELLPEQTMSFGVSYRPAQPGLHRTAVAVSFGECEGQVTVPLSGRLREPCLQIAPQMVNFGVVAQGQPSAPNLLEVLNCGDTDVDVTEVALSAGAAEEGFAWRWVEAGRAAPFSLAPRMAAQLEVSYTNNRLAEGQSASATLAVRNSTPAAPSLDVPLTVVGGGVPSCDLRVVPDRMNFGLVSRGRAMARELRVLNVGTGTCELRRQEITPLFAIPIPGFNTVKFTLTRPVAGTSAAAGQFLPFEVTYRPDVFANDVATYNLTYFDPFTRQEKVATAELSGVAGESNIEVIPGRLDFGRVTAGQCASREERVTVYNTGLVELCITDLRFEGPGCGEFFVVERPVANADGCITVTRNRPADVTLVYEPGALGADSCDLVFVSDAADSPELRVPLSGEGVASSRQVDEFVQTSGQTVDVLFVVDNSGSMGEEQTNLSDNFAAFINGAQAFQNDYQIGVVTTDMDDEGQSGRLRAPRVMRRAAGVEAQFRGAVNVGTNGSGDERGLAAAKAALSDPLAFDTGVACAADAGCVTPDRCVEGVCGGPNRGFVREEAALEVIFVSDEDDYSDASLNFYVDFLKNIKGFRNESRFHANAIVGVRDGRAADCSGPGGEAAAGSRYVEVAQRTNGRVFSICEADFGGPLQEIGNRAFGLPVQFFLSRPADRRTLSVSVGGQARPAGWSYDAASNSVVFEEGSAPQPGQTVRVEYDAQCFPRGR